MSFVCVVRGTLLGGWIFRPSTGSVNEVVSRTTTFKTRIAISAEGTKWLYSQSNKCHFVNGPQFSIYYYDKKNLLYFFFAIFQLQYLSFNHMTFVKNHELLWGQEMTKFTKKQVPFCEWGQSAQLSIYYYDKKNLFFTFFLPFFRFNIYTYIWHL